MTQTVTGVDAPQLTPSPPGGMIKRTTDDAIAVGQWSTPIACSGDDTFTATPGAGGTISVQVSLDSGLTWSFVRGVPFSVASTNGVPSGATHVRATAAGAVGTLVVDSPVLAEQAQIITGYTAAQLSALAAAGGLTQHAAYAASDTGDEYVAISASALSPRVVVEATAYVTLTATGTAFTGPCELAGYYCSVAAGNITIYDNTSATGTPIVPTQALVAGPNPIFGAGTNGKLVLGTGCHVVLSGAATVRMLVQ